MFNKMILWYKSFVAAICLNIHEKGKYYVLPKKVERLIIFSLYVSWFWAFWYFINMRISTELDYGLYALEYDLAFEVWWDKLPKQPFWEWLWLANILFIVHNLHILHDGVASGSLILTKEIVDEYFVTHHNIMVNDMIKLGPDFKIYYLGDLIEKAMIEYNIYADWLYRQCESEGIPVDILKDRRFLRYIPPKR